MKPNDRNPILYLEDIVLSMERVLEYVAGLNFRQFKWDYKTVDAVIRNFEIIGEATKRLPKDIKEKYPSIPWEEMYLLRNRISHEYFGIDYEIIWDIVINHLPENYKDVQAVLDDEKNKLK